MRKRSISLPAISMILSLLGCAGPSNLMSPPAQPGIDATPMVKNTDLSTVDPHQLWLYQLIRIDPSDPSFGVEQVPLRQSTGHLNVLSWLEDSPCSDCLKLTKIIPSGSGTMLVDLELKHPFKNLNFTGFDVRGIAMFNGSHFFPSLDVTSSDRTLGDGELVNSDGYTKLYNPGTIGHGFEGYIKGKMSTETAPNATLNGYKRFVSDDSANTRNAFYAGDTVTVTYEIDMPDGPFVLGYAVDACWAPPISKPVDDPMMDFGPEANCPEAWQISVSETPIGEGLTDCGGKTEITIDVYDSQGEDESHSVLIDCSEVTAGLVMAEWIENGIGFTRYQATIENSQAAPEGNYRCLIAKEAQENDPSGKSWLDLTAYQMLNLSVANHLDHPPVTLAEASQLSAYVGEPVYFDASDSYDGDCDGLSIVKYEWDWNGDGNFVEDSNVCSHSWSDEGTYQVQLRITDDEGTSSELNNPLVVQIDAVQTETGWARTWGGSRGMGVAQDESGNIYVAGYFGGEQDLDPGGDMDVHVSNGWIDAFLSKFSSTGDFQWARTWGAPYDDLALSVGVDLNESVYVTGYFSSELDFDPGPGEDIHAATGSNDAFLTKFDTNGNFMWANTWGGLEWDDCVSVACAPNGGVYAIGSFDSSVDFDPGPGSDIHNGYIDAYLSRFDQDGNFQWVRTWGGINVDSGRAVATDPMGNAFAGGATQVADQVDVFLRKYASNGDLQWERVWGGNDSDDCEGVDGDSQGNAFVIGNFQGEVDFDPGLGTDVHVSNGGFDTFLSKFDSDGVFSWAETWGGTADGYGDFGEGVSAAGSEAVYVTGYFSNETDFDPGSGTDIHEAAGPTDIYLSKFDANGSFEWARTWGGDTVETGYDVAALPSGTAYVTGFFASPVVDFDPGPEEDLHYPGDDDATFLSKFLSDGYW